MMVHLMRSRWQSKVPARDDNERGFTLIEILIALALFALVSVMAYRATSAMTDSELRLSQEAAHWRSLEQVFERIESDLQQALPRQMKSGNELLPAFYGRRLGDNTGSLRFARAPSRLPTVVSANNPVTLGQRIAYEWYEGRLEMLYWPGFDTAQNVAPQRFLLLSGLTAFEIEYLSYEGQWLSDWQAADPDIKPLPRAIRIRLAGSDRQLIERVFVML